MKITLITCTYNAESVIQPTLNSILHQTSADIEHIIIDGKSKDNTLAIVEQYKATSNMTHTGHSIIVQSETDKGLYDAMNKGIQKATGDYLCFMNAGDRLASEHTIEDIIKKIEASGKEHSVVYGETDVVDENGTFIRHRRLQTPEKLNWRSFRQGMLVCHQSFYANTKIAKQVGYNLKYKLSADVDWCIRIMKEGEKQKMSTLNTKSVLCKYLEGGMSVKNHRASLIERLKIMVEHYGIIDTIMLHLWFAVRAVLKK